MHLLCLYFEICLSGGLRFLPCFCGWRSSGDVPWGVSFTSSWVFQCCLPLALLDLEKPLPMGPMQLSGWSSWLFKQLWYKQEIMSGEA